MTKKQTVQETKVKAIKKIWRTLEQDRMVIIVYGGAGSGKSYTTALYLITTALQEPELHILVSRKANPSLKLSAWQLVKNLLDKLEVPYTVKYSEQTITLPNSSVFVFRGMDDSEKIKSMEFHYAWLEEATEFEQEDFLQVKLRLRRARPSGRKNKVILTFNPVPSWIQSYFFEEKREPDVAVVQTTYLDNPFLSKEYITLLQQLKHQSKTHYQIYVLGEFTIPEHIVYDNWETLDKNEMPAEFDEIIYGVDFGFNNPSAVLKIGLKDGDVYVLDEIYRQYLTNADLIELLKTFVHDKRAVLYCDSAEPQRIEELRRADFSAQASNKNVKDGIDFLKRRTIYITKHCTNTLREIKTYSWKHDVKGNVTDEPVKFDDHTMDALRYAVYTHMHYAGTKIFDKQEWGVF